MAYCDRDDVEKQFGRRNIERWADLDNEGDQGDIEDRIEWACDNSSAFIDARLLNGHYAIPFDAPYPIMIIFLAAMYAGILLYDGRQVVSADDHDLVSRQRKDFDRYLRQIHKGQLKLFDAYTGDPLDVQAYNAMFVVTS